MIFYTIKKSKILNHYRLNIKCFLFWSFCFSLSKLIKILFYENKKFKQIKLYIGIIKSIHLIYLF